jgi:ADP-dependent NAD(P)H-hydrate dehydratase / NAD(P)H-hydrate epimerase
MILTGPILTAADMRAAEEAAMAAGDSVDILMERAGAAVAEAAWRFGAGRPVLVMCGPGNNGGDGYVAARLLKERGLEVRVAATGEPRTDVAKRARAGWTGPVEVLAEADPVPVLVDAVFGTGLKRALDGHLSASLTRLRTEARFVIAVDIPSGVGTDDGSVLGAIPADLTLALGALKPCHFLQPSASVCGVIRVADIGIPVDGQWRALERPMLPRPGPDDHKYRRGMVVIVEGEMPGAAALSAGAAQRSGAGYVVLASREPPVGTSHALVVREPVAAIADDRAVACVIGPGLGLGKEAAALLDQALDSDLALILDADALTLLDATRQRRMRSRKAPMILTPHGGEFTRLFPHGNGSKLDRARDAARDLGATIIFKGADTVIASPSGRVSFAPAASAWLATAGTGDVLAGIAGALLAQGLAPHDAAAGAVWLHGEAARRAGPALIADDLARHLPAALAQCL